MATIVENLTRLIDMVEAQPAIFLDGWASQHACGTLYCGAGLAATDDFFVRQLTEPALEIFKRDGFVLGEVAGEISEAEHMWGDDCFYRLFNHAGYGRWDTDLRDAGVDNDKDLLLGRLRKQLDIYKELP